MQCGGRPAGRQFWLLGIARAKKDLQELQLVSASMCFKEGRPTWTPFPRTFSPVGLRRNSALQSARTSKKLSLQVGEHEDHSVVNANLLYETAPAQQGLVRKPKICNPSAMVKGTDVEKAQNLHAIPSFFGLIFLVNCSPNT